MMYDERLRDRSNVQLDDDLRPSSQQGSGSRGSLGNSSSTTAWCGGETRRSWLRQADDQEVEQRVENGQQVVSANFVTPYPPGYPVLVPGQVFSQEILSYMRSLDTPEVHGYRPDLGYRVYIDKALEIAAATTAVEIAAMDEQPPLPQAGPARSRSKRSSASQEPA